MIDRMRDWAKEHFQISPEQKVTDEELEKMINDEIYGAFSKCGGAYYSRIITTKLEDVVVQKKSSTTKKRKT